MSVSRPSRAARITPAAAGFAPSTRRIDAVLRIGAAAMAEETPEWLVAAKEKLDGENAEIKDLHATITKLRLALKRSKDMTASKVVELAKAQVRAAVCARRRSTLHAKLNAQAVEMKAFERENNEIVETINDLKSLCQGYVPYEGELYVEFEE
jgi:hypothetical protein